tara:strand:+ start:408 stop:695 length:288 start_codon:yes stop_codon:yes gene_type:complete
MKLYIPTLNHNKVKQVIVVILFFSILFTFLSDEHFAGIEDKKSNLVNRFLNRLYFTVITISSIGYGDYHPTSPIAKMLVLVLALYTIFFIILSID